MPGRVVMEGGQYAPGAGGGRREEGAAVGGGGGDDHGYRGGPAPVSSAAEKDGVRGGMVNGGAAGMPQYDGPADAKDGPMPNGASARAPDDDFPPEIEHITPGFRSLSTLISREAQECYNGLVQLINDLADIPVPRLQANGVNNGAVSNGAGDVSPANLKKKKMLMEFAHKHRDIFVKILVLLRWSSRAEDVSRLIDINWWMTNQEHALEEAANWIGRIKLDMNSAKVPNPDLKTAFQVLSTGKADYMPSMGYIPPKPLTPREILKLLKNLNVLLSIRINLHENLPRHLWNWSIKSGRATFVVPSEFELDVAVTEDEPSSQFYFIDTRFLFQPSQDMTDGYLRRLLEARANDILATSGLTGCYDFLHGVVLTHKIAILRRQAVAMGRTTWANSIRVEPVHRMLIVQYWVDAPGKKSWIEFGISSGKRKDGRISFKGPQPSHLAVRWMRNGVEVKDASFNFDWSDLSMEVMLKQVVDAHSRYILSSAQAQLKAKGLTTAEISEGEDGPVLSAALGFGAIKLTTAICRQTGRMFFQPTTSNTAFIVAEMNRAPDRAARTGDRIHMGLCYALLGQIERRAAQYGWKQVRDFKFDMNNLKQAFKRDVARCSLFRTRGWTNKWAMAVVITASGDSWWVVGL
ncbi:mediator complex subunit MED14-domain-containing protein [Lineolata rhizophorae]|uniref:Mediator of RNA polymerase II transcription subunit 14 n=1 Tax=Lineolata rhizophorae TaxID=578093 RepID=A0A6A6P607_9PEZI|nr:mediator complex subunit MED14-domain-containing protein [Lineolata rhizophorae]